MVEEYLGVQEMDSIECISVIGRREGMFENRAKGPGTQGNLGINEEAL